MQNVDVDQQKLKKDIDQTLVTLISRYDGKEEPLRKEERYLMAVRYFDGDTAAAKASILEADRKRTEDTIDLVGQMTKKMCPVRTTSYVRTDRNAVGHAAQIRYIAFLQI